MTTQVDPTGGLGQQELLRRLEHVAEKAAGLLHPAGDVSLRMLNHSENTTYLVTDRATGQSTILRIHRTGYHSAQAIESELEWMQALREDAGVHTPAVVIGRDGRWVREVVTDELPEGRQCVFMEFLDGVEPDENKLLANFPNLGAVTARMHLHAKGWTVPSGFERFRWDSETTLGERPHWGHWYDGLAMTEDRRAILGRLVDTVQRRLRSFGTGHHRFGLVHADMRLANLLIHDGDTRVIDFDDCGFCWYLYDLATALSFIEDRPDVPELVQAWLEGYRHIAPLSAEEEAEIPTFIMLRRMMLVAWIGSHSETDLAQSMGADYTAVSCDLAENYLAAIT